GSSLQWIRNGKTIRTEVSLGSLTVPDVATDVYRKPLFAGEDGLLGTALLDRFEAVWIDGVNHWIVFDTIRD
ncbi:MAG: hypothetical protein ACRCXD_00410, partial [Luteolibacter sp.]